MLNLSTSGYGDAPEINGTPAPIKIPSLPGQTSFFDASGFFSDDAKPIEQVAENKSGIEAKPVINQNGAIVGFTVDESLSQTAAPFVDDNPPFDVPALAEAAKIRTEEIPAAELTTAPELPPITSESLPAPVAATQAEVTVAEEIAAPPVEVSDAEAQYLYDEKLQAMETELAQLDLLVLAAKDELKAVSKSQQTAAKALRGFKYRGVESFKAALIEERQAEADEAAEAQAAAAAKENGTPGTSEHGEPIKPSRDKATAEQKPPFSPMVEPSDASTDWQNISVRELKINPKIIKRLIESKIDTLEKLEWRRRAVHDEAESWPAGIGAKKIDEIEAGIVQWFADHRPKAGAATEATEAAPEQAAEEPAKKNRKPRKKKDEAEATQEESANEPAPAEETEADHEAAILEEVEAIRARGVGNYSEPPADADLCGQWDSGYECCQSGGAVTDCLIDAGSKRTSWLKGWLAASESLKA